MFHGPIRLVSKLLTVIIWCNRDAAKPEWNHLAKPERNHFESQPAHLGFPAFSFLVFPFGWRRIVEFHHRSKRDAQWNYSEMVGLVAETGAKAAAAHSRMLTDVRVVLKWYKLRRADRSHVIWWPAATYVDSVAVYCKHRLPLQETVFMDRCSTGKYYLLDQTLMYCDFTGITLKKKLSELYFEP